MTSIKLPLLFTDPKFWIAVAAIGITFVGWRSGSVATPDAYKYAVGVFVALKLALGLQGSKLAAGNGGQGGDGP